MEDIIKTYKGEKYILEIHQDEHAENPRLNQDNFGTFAMWHRRYNMGDVNPIECPEEYMEDIPAERESMPVFMIDHSGIGFSTGDFNDPWDSGQVGFIWVSHEQIKEEFGDLNPETLEKARGILKSEIEQLDHYARGYCYGFKLFEITTCKECGHVNKEEIESVWGFVTDKPETIAEDNISQEIMMTLVEE